MEKNLEDVDTKQAYEWVKTGHWSRHQFEEWVRCTLLRLRNAS